MNLGIIKNIEEVANLKLGYEEYDGYKVETTQKIFYILIENGQCCCESWGYLSTNDNIQDFIGKEISKISLTDTNLSNKELEEIKYLDYAWEGGIQFVTFYMTDGEVLQLAVYNGHNGYYGHSILIAEDDKILLQETL